MSRSDMTTATPPSSSTPAADPGCAPTEARAMGPDVAGQVAVVLKALADPLRLRMLSFLTASATGEACVCDIAGVADVSQPTVSHHLKVLKDVGLLTSERRGTWVWYSVVPEARRAVTAMLESFAPAALDAARHRTQPLGGLTDVDAALSRLADDLAPGTALDPGTVLRTVRESYAALVRNAGVSGHLVALTRRFAEQRLADLARTAAPRVPGRPPQVLFVCVANAGRSQLAAALLRHHAGGSVIARSAGSAPAGAVHDAVRPLLGDLGADDAFPKPLTDDAVRAADVVVTMGCGDTCPVIPGVRYEDWVVGDPALASPDGVAAIRDELDARVRALLADLVPDLPLRVRPDDTRRDDHPDHPDEENDR